MLYTKSKNSCNIGEKAMLKWGKRSKIVTLVDPLQKWKTSSFLRFTPVQNLQEQAPYALVTKVWCNGRCLCAKLRLNTHKTLKRGRDVEIEYEQTQTLKLKTLKINCNPNGGRRGSLL